MPANVIICKGDANITLSGYALLNRNHLKIIANGHSYTFNGQSFTTNTEWYAANGQWYQG